MTPVCLAMSYQSRGARHTRFLRIGETKMTAPQRQVIARVRVSDVDVVVLLVPDAPPDDLVFSEAQS